MRMIVKTNSIDVKKKFIETDWNYFATFTSSDKDCSTGGLFLQIRENLLRWREIDPEMDYVLWFCQHQDDAHGRPHIHGAMRSTASRRTIERTHRGGFARLVRFRSEQVMGLYAYIIQQAYGEPVTPDTMADVL